MDPTDVYHDDEAWIAKYRAALVQPSGGMKFRTSLRNACNIVLLLLRKVLSNFRVWNPPKSVSSFGPMPAEPKRVLQPYSASGKKSLAETTGKRSTKKATATTARSRPPGSTGKRPAQRRA